MREERRERERERERERLKENEALRFAFCEIIKKLCFLNKKERVTYYTCQAVEELHHYDSITCTGNIKYKGSMKFVI